MSRNAHPSLPEFEYIKPVSFAEACKFLADNAGNARPLMGGTDTFVRIRDGFYKEEFIVDVKGLPGMKEIHFDVAKGLTVGAAVSMNSVAENADVQKVYPMLAEACNSVASYQLRSRATIVGNICNASPAGDTLGMSILLDAELTVVGVDGKERIEPVATFFKGPGRTVLQTGELVKSIFYPIPKKGMVGKYLKHGRNNRSDLSLVGVSAIAYEENGLHVKVAYASVGPTPVVVKEVEEYFLKNEFNDENIKEASQIAMDHCSPIDDVRSSARYRKLMVKNLTKRILNQIQELR